MKNKPKSLGSTRLFPSIATILSLRKSFGLATIDTAFILGRPLTTTFLREMFHYLFFLYNLQEEKKKKIESMKSVRDIVDTFTLLCAEWEDIYVQIKSSLPSLLDHLELFHWKLLQFRGTYFNTETKSVLSNYEEHSLLEEVESILTWLIDHLTTLYASLSLAEQTQDVSPEEIEYTIQQCQRIFPGKNTMKRILNVYASAFALPIPNV